MKNRIGLRGALVGALLVSNAAWGVAVLGLESETADYAQNECKAATVALATVLAMGKSKPRAEIVAAVRASGAPIDFEDAEFVRVGNLFLHFQGERLLSVDRMFGPQICTPTSSPVSRA